VVPAPQVNGSMTDHHRHDEDLLSFLFPVAHVRKTDQGLLEWIGSVKKRIFFLLQYCNYIY